MAWIKFDKDLVNDPRVIRAAEGLASRYTMSIEGVRGPGFAVGTDLSEKEITEVMRNAVIGALVTLWVYADTHITGRDVLRISVTAIDQLVGIDGFCDAVGPEWIREDEDTYGVFTVLPGYCDKNGVESKEKRKASNAERQRRFREKLRLAKNQESNAHSNAVSNAHVTPLDQDLDQDLDQKKKSRGNSARKGSRLLPDWFPSPDLTAWASKERADLDLPVVVAKFKDYWLAVPGARGVKLDWEATFRNFIRSERAGPNGRAPDYSAVIANLKD